MATISLTQLKEKAHSTVPHHATQQTRWTGAQQQQLARMKQDWQAQALKLLLQQHMLNAIQLSFLFVNITHSHSIYWRSWLGWSWTNQTEAKQSKPRPTGWWSTTKQTTSMLKQPRARLNQASGSEISWVEAPATSRGQPWSATSNGTGRVFPYLQEKRNAIGC